MTDLPPDAMQVQQPVDPAEPPPDGGMTPGDPQQQPMGQEMPPQMAGPPPDGDEEQAEELDKVVLEALQAAKVMAEAAQMMREANEAQAAERYSTAFLNFCKGHSELAPIEAAEDLVGAPGSNSSTQGQ